MMSEIKYKVCILAAGMGTRMSPFTDELNKALIPIHGKPVISHIIEAYPPTIPLIFGIGFKGKQLQSYIEYAYPERPITFINIDNFNKHGSGPGYTLLSCEKELQCPFVLANVDAIIKGEIPVPSYNHR